MPRKLATHRISEDETRTLCGWRVEWSPSMGYVRVSRGMIPELRLVDDDRGNPPTCLKCWRILNADSEQ